MFAGTLLAAIAITAQALPISGSIGMGGNFLPVDENWDETGTAAATGIDFNPNLFLVTSSSGSFAGVSPIGTIKDLQFGSGLGINDGFGGVSAVSSIVDFWTIDAFSFELTSVAQEISSNPDNFLILSGTGIIRGAGYEATLGDWAFTGDTTNGGTFSWSAGSTAVPEPGMLSLLALGLCLIGLTAMARRPQLRAAVRLRG